MVEISLQLGVTYIFEVTVYNPATGVEIAADAVPTLTLTDPSSVVHGPYSSTLIAGTTGQYRVTVYLDSAWPEGEYLGEWSWLVSANVFKPRFTFHGHVLSVTQ